MKALEEKISRYREILKDAPDSRVYVPLADLLRQFGETEEALILLEEGLGRDPQHQSAMVVLGCTLLQTERQDHGVKVLQRVLELSPDNIVVLRLLAKHFLAIDAFTHAIPLLDRLVDFEPEKTEWAKLLNDARERLQFSDKNPSEDSDLQDQGVSEHSLATLTMVDILVSQGYLDKALAALEQMKEQNPDRQDVQKRLVQIRSGALAPGLQSHTLEVEAEELSRRRADQKKQFGEWIDNFKSGPDSSS